MRSNIEKIGYGLAVVISGTIAVGPIGLLLAVFTLLFWCVVLSSENRSRTLLYASIFIGIGLFLLALLLPAVSRAGPAAWRAQCTSKLKNIALALHNYHATYGTFPPAAVTNEAGQSLHSWRVLILPHLDEEKLYARYSFDEPWDGPNNSKLHSQMPRIFRCQSPERGPFARTNTSYVAVVGPSTVWNTEGRSSLDDIRDGPSRTILLVETCNSDVHWMQPKDLSVEEAVESFTSQEQHEQFSGHPESQFLHTTINVLNVALADGKVRAFGDHNDRNLVVALLTIDGGEQHAEIPDLETTRLRWQSALLPLFGVLIFLPAWFCRPNSTGPRRSGTENNEMPSQPRTPE